MGALSSAPLSPRRRRLKLQCPECTQEVRVGRDELVEGAAVQCRHCGIEAELAQEFDEAAGRTHWILIDPLVDYADADAARIPP